MEICFKTEDEIKICSDKQKGREVTASKSTLQEMLNKVLQAKGNNTRRRDISTGGNEEHKKW